MSFDREDFQALLAKRAQQAPRAGQSSEALLQAAVEAKYLTGSEYWDLYLRYIQSAVERSQAVEQQLMYALASPGLVEHEKIIAVKMQLLECRARIEAWESAMELPKLLMERGAEVEELEVPGEAA